jgi:hypothetical protein
MLYPLQDMNINEGIFIIDFLRKERNGK